MRASPRAWLAVFTWSLFSVVAKRSLSSRTLAQAATMISENPFAKVITMIEEQTLSLHRQAESAERVCTNKYIYIYIYMPESYFWYHFFDLSRVRNSTTFLKKIILTAARSKSRVRNSTTSEAFFCTSRWYCS